MSENPYTASQIFDNPPALNSEAEAIRKEHIKTEATIKSIGILYYLGGIAILLAAAATLSNLRRQEGDQALSLGIAVVFLAIVVAQFVVGGAIRQFKPWSRIAVGILSGIGLLGFPVGTLINAYILYVVFSSKGQMIFSAPYQDIIAATPQVRYKTSKVVWVGVLIAIVVAIVVGAIFSR